MGNQEPEMIVTLKNNVSILRFNRPQKKNCFSEKLVAEICRALEEATSDPDIHIMVMTGTGDYFSSGAEIFGFSKDTEVNNSSVTQRKTADTPLQQILSKAVLGVRNTLERFVCALIDFPKPLIAVVNGHAVGLGVTILGLFDVVYASDKATFQTPFVALGLAPEGCSTYTFPQIMGPGKAAEMILFGKQIDAQDACQSRLVTEVFSDDACLDQVWQKIFEWAQLSPETLFCAKNMMKATKKDILHKVNRTECEQVIERIQSDEFLTAMMKFFSQKSKL